MDEELADKLWKQCAACGVFQDDGEKLKEDPDDWGTYYCLKCWSLWEKPKDQTTMPPTIVTSDSEKKSLKERLAGLKDSESRPKEEATEKFLVMNDLLKSHDRGIHFYNSPHLRDICEHATAAFGDTVRGVRHNADWIKIGKLFLPVKIDGKFVLSLQQDIVDDIEEKDDENDSGTEGVHPALQDFAYQKSQKSKKETHRPYKKQAQLSIGKGGTGVLYQVVAEKVALHEEPVTVMAMGGLSWTPHIISQGSLVELFDWDNTKQWRAARYTMLQGWVKIDDSKHGPMLRPVNFQHPCKSPLLPMCMSVYENNLDHLLQFIEEGLDFNVKDESGYTPLMLAAQWGRMDCCALLLRAGADVKALSPDRETAVDIAGEEPIGMIIKALTGKKMLSLSKLVAALRQLKPEVQEVVEIMFDEIAAREGSKSYRQKIQNWEKGSEEPVVDADATEKSKTASNGLDPLCNAVFGRALNDVQEVIAGGVDINVREKIYGLTPLMLAAQWKLIDICVFLLHSGADATLTSPDDKSAMEIAGDGSTKALIKALTGQDSFNLHDLDAAMSKLGPEMRGVAETMLEQIAEDQAQLRRQSMLRTQEKIKGLTAWVIDLGLEQYLDKILGWCKSMGARDLEEVKQNWQDLADEIELKPLEWKRLRASVKKNAA